MASRIELVATELGCHYVPLYEVQEYHDMTVIPPGANLQEAGVDGGIKTEELSMIRQVGACKFEISKPVKRNEKIPQFTIWVFFVFGTLTLSISLSVEACVQYLAAAQKKQVAASDPSRRLSEFVPLEKGNLSIVGMHMDAGKDRMYSYLTYHVYG